MTARRRTGRGRPQESADRSALTALEQLPDVGPAVAGYLRLAGVTTPDDLVGKDPYAMFDELCRTTGERLDPCLLDTMIAAVRFMGGGEAKPWWAYTAERKRELDARRSDADQGGRP